MFEEGEIKYMHTNRENDRETKDVLEQTIHRSFVSLEYKFGGGEIEF